MLVLVSKSYCLHTDLNPIILHIRVTLDFEILGSYQFIDRRKVQMAYDQPTIVEMFYNLVCLLRLKNHKQWNVNSCQFYLRT